MFEQNRRRGSQHFSLDSGGSGADGSVLGFPLLLLQEEDKERDEFEHA